MPATMFIPPPAFLIGAVSVSLETVLAILLIVLIVVVILRVLHVV